MYVLLSFQGGEENDRVWHKSYLAAHARPGKALREHMSLAFVAVTLVHRSVFSSTASDLQLHALPRLYFP